MSDDFTVKVIIPREEYQALLGLLKEAREYVDECHDAVVREAAEEQIGYRRARAQREAAHICDLLNRIDVLLAGSLR